MAKNYITTFYLSLAPKKRNFLLDNLPVECTNTTVLTTPLKEENLKEETEILGVFTDSKINENIFEKLPNLKYIAALSTGFDNIDLDEAEKRNIPVSNVPAYGDDTIAEYTIGLMISLIRKIPQAYESVRSGEFTYRGLRGEDLKNKTIGIIGTGNIGEKVIDKLSTFGVKFLGHDPYRKEYLKEEYNFQYCSKEKLLKNSDIVTLHCPLTEETRYTIDKKELNLMKNSAYLINTARGELIKSAALSEALQKDNIAGAALDVLEEENILSHPKALYQKDFDCESIEATLYNEKIIDHPNTIVTPHNAFNSRRAIEKILITTCENIKTYLGGETQNLVTKEN